MDDRAQGGGKNKEEEAKNTSAVLPGPKSRFSGIGILDGESKLE